MTDHTHMRDSSRDGAREDHNPVPKTTPSRLPERYLSPDDLADLFDVSVETVYQWRRKRTGPPGFRVGRHVRYDPDELLRWVAGQAETV